MSASVREKRVFISYRRADADALAGRIRDRMAREHPDWDIFMDVASIAAGATFKQTIDDALARATVFLALMGGNWAGGTRIHDPRDMVRHEVATALSRNIQIIPVLVNDAKMPSPKDLPSEIAALPERNAVELRHTRFDDDFANLIKAVAGEHYISRDIARGGGGRSAFTAATALLWGALLGAATAMLGLVVHFELTGKSASERVGEDGAALLIPLMTACGTLIGYFWKTRRRWRKEPSRELS